MNARRGDDLRIRTKAFALEVIRFYSSLAKSELTQVLGRQSLRAGTSVGAHYREACRSRSRAEFVSKIEGGLQELDETACWLELLADAGAAPPARVAPLLEEADQLTAVLVASVRTAKSRNGPH